MTFASRESDCDDQARRAERQERCTRREREFYAGFLGFNVGMDMGWIVTFVSPSNRTAQISILRSDPSGIHPHVSVEVTDVDGVYTEAVARGLEIVYPRTDEPWGVRRFFVVDPNGLVLNVLGHRAVPRGVVGQI